MFWSEAEELENYLGPWVVTLADGWAQLFQEGEPHLAEPHDVIKTSTNIETFHQLKKSVVDDV